VIAAPVRVMLNPTLANPLPWARSTPPTEPQPVAGVPWMDNPNCTDGFPDSGHQALPSYTYSQFVSRR
jgi:hypothetical protein